MSKIKTLENKLKEKYYRDFNTFFTKDKKNLFDNNYLHTYDFSKKYMAIGLSDSDSYINNSGFDKYKVSANELTGDDLDHFKYSRYTFDSGDNAYKDTDNNGVFILTYDNYSNGTRYKLKPDIYNYLITSNNEIKTFISTKMTLGDETKILEAKTDIDDYTRGKYDEEYNKIIQMTSPYPSDETLKNSDAEIIKKILYYTENDGEYSFYGFSSLNNAKYADYVYEVVTSPTKWTAPSDDNITTIESTLDTSSYSGKSNSLYSVFGNLAQWDNTPMLQIPLGFDAKTLSIKRSSIIPDKNIAKMTEEEIKKCLIKARGQDMYYIINPKFVEENDGDMDKAVKLLVFAQNRDMLISNLRKINMAWLVETPYYYVDSSYEISESDKTSGKYKLFKLTDLFFNDNPELAYLTPDFLRYKTYSQKIKLNNHSIKSLWIPIDPKVWDY